jgi:hypothetical protein
VTTDTPFLLSIAGLSASLAGLAGLVAALRRGEGLSVGDRFRLHEIVEFCFANILLAVGLIPLTALTGSPEVSLRIGGAVASCYLLATAAILARRARRLRMPLSRNWIAVVLPLNVCSLVAAAAAALTGSVGSYETLLVIVLARPMVAFLFVMSAFESDGRPSPG